MEMKNIIEPILFSFLYKIFIVGIINCWKIFCVENGENISNDIWKIKF